MRSSAAAGALAAIVAGLAGVAMMVLEFTPPSLGFDDTDSPAIQLAYLRDHHGNYVLEGLALFTLALALIIVVFAMWDLLNGRSSSLGLRTTSTIGLFAAACFFMFGVLRFGVLPLLYIDSLKPAWGEAAYLVSQIAGVHGFAQGAIVTICAFAIGVAVLGYRARALPRWLAVLAVIPAIRLLSALGPTGLVDFLPDGLWIVFMVSIPGTFLWFVLLGLVLLRRATQTSVRPAAA